MNKANVQTAIVEQKRKLARKKISEDDLWELEHEFNEYFGEMTNVQRVALLKRFWQLDHEVTIVDRSTNCFYSSSPLLRAFTISHEHLIRQCQLERGVSLDSSKKVADAADELKHEIASVIKKYRGEVRADGKPVLKYEGKTEPKFFFFGFQPGLASDDHLIGMFFSEADREKADRYIVQKLESWGVRTEPLAEERTLHARRLWFWERHFDRKQFRRDFRKLSHEERLDVIEELNTKGIDFKFTDPSTFECYQSCWSNQGALRNSRCFSYDFDLGYRPKNGSRSDLPEHFPTASERRKEIDEIERTLLHVIAKHGGLITGIERDVYKAVVSLEQSEKFPVSGEIHARFPDYQARRDASSEIHERLAVAGIQFSVEEDEELSIDEQIAKTNSELDDKRKTLDRGWSLLESRKQFHRKELIRIEEDEQKLLEEEERFTEFAKAISDRLQQLSQQRDSSSHNGREQRKEA
ncbi:hypothetical protein EC9_29570 [Rosistilla ulvae]|uniref:Uncharacterized protein n=1 Tax=Rosistilla ulvae TaxID=1930277 RepID=A0A517M1K4_9BACT|nr:hypothetical protein [Rosistilla ulvae]QDS88763.1 hypothetical protein EC9_29570 [Rosistilla ulvae]